MTRLLCCALLALAYPAAAAAQASPTASDSAAIRQTALDYIEGYYQGDAARMEGALHPELAKRIVRTGPNGRSQLGQMSAMTLAQGTRAGSGREIPAAERRADVRILDIYRNAASARIDAAGWVDYLHLARWNGRWVIVNVLWELHPESGQ